MDQIICTAFRNGYERMAAWSGLLDDINLYPVADADTGRNLRFSLAPLRSAGNKNTARHLLMSATGNSGNIAGAFFSKFIQMGSAAGLANAAVAAKDAAWRALMDPKPGTMLSVFDALVEVLPAGGKTDILFEPDVALKHIQDAVISTAELLPELREADVVDSGALGMFLFFEGFFKSLHQRMDSFCSPHDIFGSKLNLSFFYNKLKDINYCIDTVIIPRADAKEATRKASAIGEHLVAVSDGKHLKIHLHAADTASAKADLAALGEVLQWHTEKIENPNSLSMTARENPQGVHIVTDAAGSLAPDVARELGVSVLDSYIIMDEAHVPESMVTAEHLYLKMKSGAKVTTAQASIFERHQHYAYLSQRYKHLIYLCVGSAYTGNYEIASRWAAENKNGRRMMVIDTGAASGRLGLIACRVARYANAGRDWMQTARYAREISGKCDELVFLDQLKYLAAGGRISKTNGFFGDLLRIKPVVRPGAQGAQKVAAVRNRKAQVEFALDHLGSNLDTRAPAEILLQYTDNQDWVISHLQPRVQSLLPQASVSAKPMSLTSGVHMGPGTWAVAFLPDTDGPDLQ